MHLLPKFTNRHTMSIPKLLVSRDERRARQHAWLKRHLVPLTSFTMVAPGPAKDSEIMCQIFNHGVTALRILATRQGWQIQGQAALVSASGPGGILSITAPTRDLRLATIELERNHPLGRSWDIDVLTPEGDILSHRDYPLPLRRCLLCEQSMAVCARGKTHQSADLPSHIETLLNDVDACNINQNHKAYDVTNR